MEGLEEGLRISTFTSSVITAGMPQLAGGVSQSTIMTTIGDIKSTTGVGTGNLTAAEAALHKLDNDPMVTPDMSALRQFLWASLHIRQQRFQDALTNCDAIEATGQDVPIIWEYRTIAYSRLGQYAKALDMAQKWEDALGGDRDLYFERGKALSRLNRPADAAVELGKGVDKTPTPRRDRLNCACASRGSAIDARRAIGQGRRTGRRVQADNRVAPAVAEYGWNAGSLTRIDASRIGPRPVACLLQRRTGRHAKAIQGRRNSAQAAGAVGRGPGRTIF